MFPHPKNFQFCLPNPEDEIKDLILCITYGSTHNGDNAYCISCCSEYYYTQKMTLFIVFLFQSFSLDYCHIDKDGLEEKDPSKKRIYFIFRNL